MQNVISAILSHHGLSISPEAPNVQRAVLHGELVSIPRSLCSDLGIPSNDFDTFMQELTTLPGAAAILYEKGVA